MEASLKQTTSLKQVAFSLGEVKGFRIISRLNLSGLRLFVIVVVVGFAFPGSYLIWKNFVENADPWGTLLSERTLEPLFRTVRLAISVSISAAFIGVFLAWVTVRTDLPGSRIWRVLMPIPLIFPTFIGAAALIRTMNPGGLLNELITAIGFEKTLELKGFFGAWLALTLFTYPYVYLPVAAKFHRLSGSLEESARVLGDSAVKVFFRVVMPQAAVSVLASTLLVFLYTVSDFGVVQLMRYDTLTRAIYTNHLARPPLALALSVILLSLAAVFVLFERGVSSRLKISPVARTRHLTKFRLGRWHLPALFGVVLIFLLAIGAPLATLLYWAYQGITRENKSDFPLTINAYKVFESSWNTLQISVVTAIVTVLVVMPVAFLMNRHRSRLGSVAHTVIISTFALPGILVALAVTYWVRSSETTSNLIAGTLGLLIFALVVRFGSLAMGVVLDSVQSVSSRLHDAAASLGAGRFRRFRTVDLPALTPGLLAAAGLILLSTMKELPITLLVAPLGFPTLTTRIFQSFEDAFIAEAGILSVVLVGLSSLLSWFFIFRRSAHL